MTVPTRRQILISAFALIGGTGMSSLLAIKPTWATPAMMRAAIRKVVGEAPLRKGKVRLDLPPLIENGNTVPMTISVDSPMTEADHVKAIHVFNEKSAAECLEHPARPRAGKAAISSRIRLADSRP
jgi:sulfur-oxidizing protein SoxY